MNRKLALLLTIALTNCALASHGTQQTIRVSSEPAGARAAMICDGRLEGESLTPGAITIKRRHDDDRDLRVVDSLYRCRSAR